MNFSIRNASLKDAKKISALVIRNALPSLPDKAHTFMVDWNKPEKISERFSENYEYYLAEDKEKLVGVLGIKEYVKEPNHLYHLFVDESNRRMGIAEELWKHYLAQRPEIAANKVFRVNSSLMAVHVYKKFGFMENGKPFEKNHIPCIPMLLNLSNA